LVIIGVGILVVGCLAGLACSRKRPVRFVAHSDFPLKT
jgi:hypothetical protein